MIFFISDLQNDTFHTNQANNSEKPAPIPTGNRAESNPAVLGVGSGLSRNSDGSNTPIKQQTPLGELLSKFKQSLIVEILRKEKKDDKEIESLYAYLQK